jgi:hypothetical protein
MSALDSREQIPELGLASESSLITYLQLRVPMGFKEGCGGGRWARWASPHIIFFVKYL